MSHSVHWQEHRHDDARTWHALVDRELGGRLGPRARPRLHDHLRSCEGCRAYYDRGARALRALGGREHGAVRPELDLVGSWLVPEPFGTRVAQGVRFEVGRLSGLWRLRARHLIAVVATVACVLVVRHALNRPPEGGTVLTSEAPELPATNEGARPPRPASDSPLPDLSAATVLGAFAFDDAGWVAGEVAAAPPDGSRRALRGVRYNPKTQSLGVIFQPEAASALTVEEGTWVTFRYWLGEEPSHRPYVEVAIALEGSPDFVWRLRETEQGRWVTMAARLADFRPYREPTRSPLIGARAHQLKIRTNAFSDDTFFVDDVKVLRLAPP